MSVTEIQRAVSYIRTLPANERVRVYRWAMAEMEPEAAYAMFDQACEDGRYAEVIAETDQDYRQGRALTELY